MGGLIGFIFSYTVNLSGIIHPNTTNFIVAGMAAALAAVMHAPLTGIFLIAEITGGYVLMVPLMITSAIAYMINRASQTHSIYTKGLAEKGELMSYEDKDSTVLNQMKLKFLIEKDHIVLHLNDSLSDRMEDIQKSKKNICAVIDDNRHFRGLVYVEELYTELLKDPKQQSLIVSHITHSATSIIRHDDDVKSVLTKMEKENTWLLPVIDKENNFMGFVSKTAIFNKYRALLMRQGGYN